MSDNFEFQLEIDLAPGGNKEVFQSLEDFEQWVNVEKSFWIWPNLKQGDDEYAWSAVRNFINQLQNFSNTIDQLKSYRSGNNIHAYSNSKNNLQHDLEHFYTHQFLLHSSQPKAKFIKNVSEKSPVISGLILRYYTNRNDFHPQYPKHTEAVIYAQLFESGLWGREAGETEALNELHKKWTAGFNDLKTTLQAVKDDRENTFQAIEVQKDSQQTQFSEFLRQAKESHEALKSATADEFKKIEETYEKKLALHAATKYWEEKTGNHAIWAGFLVFGVLGAFALSIWGIYTSMRELVGEATWQTVQVWKVGLVFALATMAVWAIRILIRLLLSQLHLHNDAKERRTMILTYLALIRKDKIPQESRDLILQVLFRPASTGIVRDDGVPPFMAEWLKKTTGSD